MSRSWRAPFCLRFQKAIKQAALQPQPRCWLRAPLASPEGRKAQPHHDSLRVSSLPTLWHLHFFKTRVLTARFLHRGSAADPEWGSPASELVLFARTFETSSAEPREAHRNNCIRLSGLGGKTMAFLFPADCKWLWFSLEGCFPSLASSCRPVDPETPGRRSLKPPRSPRHASHQPPSPTAAAGACRAACRHGRASPSCPGEPHNTHTAQAEHQPLSAITGLLTTLLRAPSVEPFGLKQAILLPSLPPRRTAARDARLCETKLGHLQIPGFTERKNNRYQKLHNQSCRSYHYHLFWCSNGQAFSVVKSGKRVY